MSNTTHRWLLVTAVMSATLMQVLDTTIVNVALPHMQGSLEATSDEISWTLTSYLIASAIMMPMTGYFTDRLGQRKYLLICIAGFTIFSLFCGGAMTLIQLVIFRLLQGAFGGALVPLSQAILTDSFPENERGRAMAIWGVGIMIGPVLGPTLGGYLTEVASWRWTFYINLPVGLMSFILGAQYIPDSVKKIRKMDWLGFFYLATAIGFLQYLLDSGNREDWFSSSYIKAATVLSISGFILFLMHSFRSKQKTVIKLSILKDWNFTLGCIILSMMGMGMYGAMVIQPLMLEGLLNYPVLTTGLVMAPRGISGIIGMIIIGRIINFIDARLLILFGVLLNIISMGACTHYSIMIDEFWIIWPLALQGLGLSFIFVPLSVVTFSTLPEIDRIEGAGIYSLLRILGSSLGISIVIAAFTRSLQITWNQLGGSIQPYNPSMYSYLDSVHLTMGNPLSNSLLVAELTKQTNMISFVNAYYLIMWSFILMIPFVCLLKKTNPLLGSNLALAAE